MVVGLPRLTRDVAVLALRDGVSPTRAVLSQARYLTLPTNSPQPGLAVLLAAVAAETHAKRALRLCLPSARALKTLQDQAGTALALYGEIALQVIGRSLEVEEPVVWGELAQLFTARNKMAHHLATPAHLDARRMVVAAMQAMDWLA